MAEQYWLDSGSEHTLSPPNLAEVEQHLLVCETPERCVYRLMLSAHQLAQEALCDLRAVWKTEPPK